MANLLKNILPLHITNTIVAAMLVSKQHFIVKYLISIYSSTYLLSSGLIIALYLDVIRHFTVLKI
ncbi:MAG: hypothetical protein M3224_08950, partial [Thermoproteota archaeon]|nr:hypothetical protein [Thermoproteota archaeon]